MPIDRLYVARDDTTTIVSRRRIRVAGPGLAVSRWGGVEESVSERQSILPAPSLLRAATVVLPPGAVTAALWLAGTGPDITFLAGAATFFAGAYLIPLVGKRRRAAPRSEGFGALFDAPEREQFDQALEVARRVTETWPALSGLIDQRDAQWALNEALWELAVILGRRQDARRIVESLEGHRTDELSPTSELGESLAGQLAKAVAALGRLDADIAARRASIASAEETGRRFVREQELIRKLREASRSLDAQPADAAGVDAASELADRTAAVIEAYRELSEDYRHGSTHRT